jgi:hypothetical protein
MDDRNGTSNGRPAWTDLLDLGARWLRARSERRDTPSLGEHGHWDPVNRDWRYHTHESEKRAS